MKFYFLSLSIVDYGWSCAFEWNALDWRSGILLHDDYSVSQYKAYCSKMRCSPMSFSVLVHYWWRYLTLMQTKNVICFVWNLNTNWPNKLTVYNRKSFREKETLWIFVNSRTFQFFFPVLFFNPDKIVSLLVIVIGAKEYHYYFNKKNLTFF